MSEYQYVVFRAIDRPVNEANLEYMEQQSSRAEITPWSFQNEYHYGNFRGNAKEMLRRGYDIHLHYANYGTRTLMIRLPHGLPDAQLAKPYLVRNAIEFQRDSKGPGGILVIEPSLEGGDLEDIWDVGPHFERLIGIRAEILAGDLRPLYLAHLGISCDSNHDPGKTFEAPVPAGLAKLTKSQAALADLYELSDYLIEAATTESPPLTEIRDPTADYRSWVKRQKLSDKDEWLAALLTDYDPGLRTELVAKCRSESKVASWPTARPHRGIRDLLDAAEALQYQANLKAVSQAARDRKYRLAAMRKDPAAIIIETEKLVGRRNMYDYEKIGQMLAELREALAETKQAGLAEAHAHKLRAANPTLKRLLGALRKHGFLAKK